MNTLSANNLSKLDLSFLNLVAPDEPTYNLVMALASHIEKNPLEAALQFCTTNGDFGLIEKNKTETSNNFLSLMTGHASEVCDFLVSYADTIGVLKNEHNKHIKVMKLLKQDTDILISNSQASVAEALFGNTDSLIGKLVKSEIVSYTQECLAVILKKMIEDSSQRDDFHEWLKTMVLLAQKLKSNNKNKYNASTPWHWQTSVIIEPISSIVTLAEVVGVTAVLNALDNTKEGLGAYNRDKEFDLKASDLEPLYTSLRASLDPQSDTTRKKVSAIAKAEAGVFLMHCPEPITLASDIEPSIDVEILLNITKQNNYFERFGVHDDEKALDDALCVLASVSSQVLLNRAKKWINNQ